jgi:hypothetical protein
MAVRGRTEIKENCNCYLKIVAPKEGIAKDKQVFIQYGRYSNRQLLCQYGFAITGNKYDYYSVRFDLEEVYLEKGLSYAKPNEKEFLEFKLKRGRLNEDLLQFIAAKLWNYENDGIDEFFLKEKGLFYDKVIGEYRKVILQEIEKLATSLEQDLEIMNKSRNHRMYFALVYRMQRKEILLEHLKICGDGIQE